MRSRTSAAAGVLDDWVLPRSFIFPYVCKLLARVSPEGARFARNACTRTTTKKLNVPAFSANPDVPRQLAKSQTDQAGASQAQPPATLRETIDLRKCLTQPARCKSFLAAKIRFPMWRKRNAGEGYWSRSTATLHCVNRRCGQAAFRRGRTGSGGFADVVVSQGVNDC